MAGKEFKVGVAIVGKDRASGIMGKSLNRIGMAAKRARMAVGGLASKLGGIGALAGVAGVGGAAVGLYKLAEGAAKSGDEIAKTAKQAGISAQAFAELRHAADLAGVSSNEFGKGAVYFNRALGDAKNGTGALTTALNKFSPALLEQLKGATSTEEAMDLYNGVLADTKDESLRASLAVAAYGRAGAKIAPMFANGTEAVEKARAEFAKYFGEIDGDGLKTAEDFIDAQARMKLAIGGVKYAIGSQLLPVLQPLIDRFRDWTVKNRAMIAERVAGWVENVGTKLGGLADWWSSTGSPAFGAIVDVAKKIGEGFDWIAQKSGPGAAGIAAIGAASAIAFGPIGLVATAIGAVVTNLDKFQQAWGMIPEFLQQQMKRGQMMREGRLLGMGAKERRVAAERARRPLTQSRVPVDGSGQDSTMPRGSQTLESSGMFMGQPGQVQVDISVSNLPPWMTMERPRTTGPVRASSNVGYRRLATEGAR